MDTWLISLFGCCLGRWTPNYHVFVCAGAQAQVAVCIKESLKPMKTMSPSISCFTIGFKHLIFHYIKCLCLSAKGDVPIAGQIDAPSPAATPGLNLYNPPAHVTLTFQVHLQTLMVTVTTHPFHLICQEPLPFDLDLLSLVCISSSQE